MSNTMTRCCDIFEELDLTRRQFQILDLYRQGHSLKEIAKTLGTTYKAVITPIRRLLEQTNFTI